MSVFRSIVFSAVVSGLIAGRVITVAQQFSTVPLILKAETYEHDEAEGKLAAVAPAATSASVHDHSNHDHAAHQHDAAAWKQAEGVQRHTFTAAANVLTAIGFAL